MFYNRYQLVNRWNTAGTWVIQPITLSFSEPIAALYIEESIGIKLSDSADFTEPCDDPTIFSWYYITDSLGTESLWNSRNFGAIREGSFSCASIMDTIRPSHGIKKIRMVPTGTDPNSSIYHWSFETVPGQPSVPLCPPGPDSLLNEQSVRDSMGALWKRSFFDSASASRRERGMRILRHKLTEELVPYTGVELSSTPCANQIGVAWDTATYELVGSFHTHPYKIGSRSGCPPNQFYTERKAFSEGDLAGLDSMQARWVPPSSDVKVRLFTMDADSIYSIEQGQNYHQQKTLRRSTMWKPAGCRYFRMQT